MDLQKDEMIMKDCKAHVKVEDKDSEKESGLQNSINHQVYEVTCSTKNSLSSRQIDEPISCICNYENGNQMDEGSVEDFSGRSTYGGLKGNKIKPMFCSQCNFKTNKKQAYINHMLSHSKSSATRLINFDTKLSNCVNSVQDTNTKEEQIKSY